MVAPVILGVPGVKFSRRWSILIYVAFLSSGIMNKSIGESPTIISIATVGILDIAPAVQRQANLWALVRIVLPYLVLTNQTTAHSSSYVK